MVRLGDYPQEPFRRAANTPALHAAFDALVGRDRWIARLEPRRLSRSASRATDEPDDAGWHADAGFYGDDGSLRLNLRSSGRALLMLFLFTDVDENDAPTRIEVGSHLDVPRLLAARGRSRPHLPRAGRALRPRLGRIRSRWRPAQRGDVYLCHPFLVHAAQRHRGDDAQVHGAAAAPARAADRSSSAPDGDYSPVETAIRIGLGFRSDDR